MPKTTITKESAPSLRSAMVDRRKAKIIAGNAATRIALMAVETEKLRERSVSGIASASVKHKMISAIKIRGSFKSLTLFFLLFFLVRKSEM